MKASIRIEKDKIEVRDEQGRVMMTYPTKGDKTFSKSYRVKKAKLAAENFVRELKLA